MSRRAESSSFDYFIETCCGHDVLTKEQEKELSIRVMAGRQEVIDKVINRNKQQEDELFYDLDCELLKKVARRAGGVTETRERNEAILADAQAHNQNQIDLLIADRDMAIEELVNKNQQFVVHVAKGFVGLGVSLEDLVQEGNIGLFTAAGRFEYDKGFKFITYAVWWIRQAMQRAVSRDGRPVCLPAATSLLCAKTRKINADHKNKHGFPASVDDLSEITGSEATARATEVMMCTPLSLNVFPRSAHSGEEGSNEAITLIESKAPSQEEVTLQGVLHSRLEEFLDTAKLPKNGAKVLRMHFGLDGGGGMNLEQISKVLGCCRENVRQLRDKSMRKMRGKKAIRDIWVAMVD